MGFGVGKILKRGKQNRNEKIHGEQLFYLLFCVCKYSRSSHPEALTTMGTTVILPVLVLTTTLSYKIPSEMEVATSAPSAEGAEGDEGDEGAEGAEGA